MATLSLCVICKNEEKNIENLLKSVEGTLFDEIVIVDTGSTDKTVEIAKKYTKNVYFFEWINDFSAARNYSFSKATKDYILWLDSDDVLLSPDYKKLLDLKDKLHESDIWLVKYEYAHDEFGNSSCSFFRERIVRRSLNLQWQQPIHEYLPLSGSMRKTDIEVHHYKKHVSSERNIKILADIVEKNPNDARNMYYYGKELMDYDQSEKGYNLLKKFVTMHGAWNENIYTAHLKMASYEQSLKKYNEAKKSCLEAMGVYPLKSEVYCKLGEIAMNQNDWMHAVHWYTIASNLERPEGALDVIEPMYYTWLPHLQLCLAYNNLGNVDKAALHNAIALSYRQLDSRMLSNEVVFKNNLKDKYKYHQETLKKNLYEYYNTLETKVAPITSNASVAKELELPKTNLKIGWCVPAYNHAGTIRIRTLNVSTKLKEMGYVSEIISHQDAEKFDIIIIGKNYDAFELDFVKKLKQQGKLVVADLSEDILEYSIVRDILAECHTVVCCSNELKKKVMTINKSAILIEDAVEHLIEN